MQNIRQPILKTCLNMNVFEHFLGVSSHSIGKRNLIHLVKWDIPKMQTFTRILVLFRLRH